jgi:8-amino-7-oxononanoate synthase
LDIFDKCRTFNRPQQLIQAELYPYFRAIEHSSCTRVTVGGRELVMIGSNNYLGLTHDKRVIDAAKQAAEEYGSSCTGSRFLNGTLAMHEELERRLALFMGFPSCVTFSTGFQVNLGVISAVAGKDDVIFCDRENHASIIDACRLALAQTRKFRHDDMEDLEEKLKNTNPKAGKLIVVDGVFSMVGHITNLPEILKLAKKYGARVMVDDAHGVGVLGKHGRGTIEHFGLEGPYQGVDIVMGTFSKSLASLGGFVVATEEVINFIKHNARALIFSASPSPSNTAAALAALDIIETEPWRIEKLWRNVKKMKDGLDAMGYDTMGSLTPIIPIRVGDDIETFSFAKELAARGLFVNPVVPPGAPMGLVRTSYMASHSDEELDFALDVLRSMAQKRAGLVA